MNLKRHLYYRDQWDDEPRFTCAIWEDRDAKNENVLYHMAGAGGYDSVNVDGKSLNFCLGYQESENYESTTANMRSLADQMDKLDKHPKWVVCPNFRGMFYLLTTNPNRKKFPEDATLDNMVKLMEMVEKNYGELTINTHTDSIFMGALGAALFSVRRK